LFLSIPSHRIYILTDKGGKSEFLVFDHTIDLVAFVKLMMVFVNETLGNFYTTPLQKWIYLAEHVYGAPDPKPPANAMADCTKEVDDKSITWVTRRSALIPNVTHWEYPCNSNPTTYGAPYPM
jgi:hypothetical protein